MRKIIIFITLLTLCGCNTTGSTKKTQAQPVVTEKAEYSVIFPDINDKQPFKPYAYALLENNSGWRTVKVSTSPFARKNEDQEIIAVDESLTKIMPVYDSLYNVRGFTEDGNKRVVVMCASHVKETTDSYHPCNSEFYSVDVGKSAIGSLFLLPLQAFSLGTNGVGAKTVESDPNALIEACTEANVFASLRTYGEQVKKAQLDIAKVQINPQITDSSGCFKGTWQDLLIPQYTTQSPTSDSKAIGSLFLKDYKACRYDFSVDNRSYDLTASTKEVTPKIHIKSYRPERWTINRLFNNQDLSLDIEKASAGQSWVRFTYTINNHSNGYINVTSKQFYVNDDIATNSIPQSIPPQASKDTSDLCNQSSVQGTINSPVTKNNLNRQVRIAVAINYTLNGQPKSLFSEQYVRLGDMI